MGNLIFNKIIFSFKINFFVRLTDKYLSFIFTIKETHNNDIF